MAIRRIEQSAPDIRRARGATRRQLSQNFLHDRRVVHELCDELAGSSLPVIELGAGSGAVTGELVRRGVAVTAVELDPRWASTLRRRFGGSVRVVQTDMLRFRFPDEPHNVVSNVPYSITTALLRHLLVQRSWQAAVLMVQWEVARKRSGSSLLTASWWPWYDIALVRRVPAGAFRPVPRVDSGVLRIVRRTDPLIPDGRRRAYQHFVATVFTGRGGRLAGALARRLPRTRVRRWMREYDVDPAALPRDLTARQWVALYELASDR
ncbi:MAG TPA: 23S ribosomal RNA methyltransferase Erm [Jiangellaceae bacterium]